MIIELEKPKTDFNQALNKGKLLNLSELIPQEMEDVHIKNMLHNWYRNITELNFLPEFPEDLEEIIIHSPTNIIFRTRSEQVNYDSDLTREDFNLILDYLSLKNQISWNLKSPFTSFFSTLRERQVRMTMIHGATNQENRAKIFIRFLNQKTIPLSAYGEISDQLRQCVLEKKNILISGATGSGKTTFMNSLLEHIPKAEHTIILEDTKELISPHENVTNFLSAPDNGEEYTLLSYLKYAMRMTPQRIIIGELRSKEVEPLLSALNSGHNGLMSSIHANNAPGALEKFALLCQLYGKTGLDYKLVLKLICQNIDYVVHIDDKKVAQVIQVFGSDDGQIFFEDLILNR